MCPKGTSFGLVIYKFCFLFFFFKTPHLHIYTSTPTFSNIIAYDTICCFKFRLSICTTIVSENIYRLDTTNFHKSPTYLNSNHENFQSQHQYSSSLYIFFTSSLSNQLAFLKAKATTIKV